MSIFKKIAIITLLVLMLASVACGAKPQPVTQQQFDEAKAQAEAAESRAAAQRAEKEMLEAEYNAKKAKLDVLQVIEPE